MSDTIVLRAAVPGDEALVARFVRDLAEYEHLTHEVLGTEADYRRALFGTPQRLWALFACRGDEPVGFALWFYTFSTFAGRPSLYVEDVFVRPEQRGRGIGRMIFRHLAGLALQEGCARMEWTVLDWNAPAIGFYRAIGARPRDEWTIQRLDGEALRAFAQ
ncbi:GNAT family N-acetyltransferase [Rhodovastum atsumiense]|uniref:GNAT family N-acetyltransferase n=1 Tax=Rhodovastum atsumiense TaxID=504468 RepID=A0A5M6J240_9PROT|nr:GNAT family N-acetyltransferase [Rhodovastum atsumiense]KAA5614686.1 GNAT family N-acetyltransferase [Rhodovastum atsumiense]CAH2599782.1 GNAT family N-acetyltransferase [Rhodovastum atsumiense]